MLKPWFQDLSLFCQKILLVKLKELDRERSELIRTYCSPPAQSQLSSLPLIHFRSHGAKNLELWVI